MLPGFIDFCDDGSLSKKSRVYNCLEIDGFSSQKNLAGLIMAGYYWSISHLLLFTFNLAPQSLLITIFELYEMNSRPERLTRSVNIVSKTSPF